MIVKITRGAQVGGLMRYLVGEGKRNEHTNPHLVAGSPEVMSWYSHRQLDVDDARAIARVVDQPRLVHGTSVTVKASRRELEAAGVAGGAAGVPGPGGVLVDEGRRHTHVWHCSLSLPPTAARLGERSGEDRGRQVLDDQAWEQLAMEFVDEMGFTAASGKSPCRWAAVHHGFTSQGGDHIHIAVVLVREDGTRASTHNDYRTASAAAARLERKYGLEAVAGREVGRSARGLSTGEDAIARRRSDVDAGRPADAARREAGGGGEMESYADRLTRKVRAAAAVAKTEAEFVSGCRDQGLVLRPRFAEGSTSEVMGFAVAEPHSSHPAPVDAVSSAGGGAAAPEEPLQWRAAGKLSRDLTLPRLRVGFAETPESRVEAAALWRASRGLVDAGAAPQVQGRGAGVQPRDAGAEAGRWRDAALEVAGLRERLRTVPVDDHAAWASVSHEVAGVLAAWSVATEDASGHLAAASDVMGRSAALHRRAVGPALRRPVSLRGPALLVASIAAGSGSKTGQALLLRELLNLMRAVNLAMAETRQARDAARIEETVRARLHRLQASLPPPPKLSADLDVVQLLHRDRSHRLGTTSVREAATSAQAATAAQAATVAPVVPPRRGPGQRGHGRGGGAER